MKTKDQYRTLTVEAAKTGWVVRRAGQPPEIFIRWDALVRHLENNLTSKGDQQDKLLAFHLDEEKYRQ